MDEGSDDKVKRVYALLAVNQVYTDFIDKLIAKVDRAIEKNRKLQVKILLKHKIQLQEDVKLCSASQTNKTTRNLVAYVPCYHPYFKDSNGMVFLA